MKLKARLQKNLLFFKIAQAVEKIGNSCYIRFTRDDVFFGAIHSRAGDIEADGGSAIHCWSKIPVDNLFLEYKIESTANNEIYLETKAEDFILAMRSCNNAHIIVMRMTGSSSNASLTFVITEEDHQGDSREIVQGIPILKIMTAEGAHNTSAFEEPLLPAPSAHIFLPPLEQIRHIVTSYKTLADYIVISVNIKGSLIFTTSDGAHPFNTGFHSNLKKEPSTRNNSGSNDDDNDDNNHDDDPKISALFGEAEKAQVQTRFTGLTNPELTDEALDDNSNQIEEHPYLERSRNRPHEYTSVLIRVTDLQR
ncbi:hypothetical protein BG004_004964 [Podila humilis]|nr:hypothetical protein BG004_004964 [Podila humilis]